MIISPADQIHTDAVFNNLGASLPAQIECATVLLRCGNFTGSGVLIIRDYEQSTGMVLTAAHNLLIAAKGVNGINTKPNTWQANDIANNTKAVIDHFKANGKVHFLAADHTHATNSDNPLTNKNQLPTDPTPVDGNAAISKIKLVSKSGNVGGWDTDLCTITFKFDKTNRPRSALLGSGSPEQYKSDCKAQAEFIDQLPLNANTQTKVNNLKKYQFIQAGYGWPSADAGALYTGTLRNLKHRCVEFTSSDATPVNVEGEDAIDEYKNVFLLTSAANNTSLPGDSGGPVYGVELGSPYSPLYLVGINLGADFFEEGQKPPGADDEPDGTYNNAATSAEAFFRPEG